MSAPSTPQRIARAVSSGAWTPAHFLAYSPAPSRGVSGESATGVTSRVSSETPCPIFGTTASSRSYSGMLPGSFPPIGMTEQETIEWDRICHPPVPTLALPAFPYGSPSASRSVSGVPMFTGTVPNTPAFRFGGGSGLPVALPMSHRTEVFPSVLHHPGVFENETDDEDEMTEVATPPPTKRPRLEPPAAPVATRRSQRIQHRNDSS
jgi:hypothetical protein